MAPRAPCVVDRPGQVGERESDVVGVVGPVERVHLVLRHLRRDVVFLGRRGHDVEDGRDGDGAGVAGEPWDVLLWRDWTVCRKSLVAADESVPQSKCLWSVALARRLSEARRSGLYMLAGIE